MAKDHLADYDTTAGNNTDVDGVNIAEGWAPENVNNAIREMMADLAELHGDITGKLTAAGAAGDFTLTTNDGIAVPAQGQRYVFIANHAPTGAVTLAVNGGTAKSIVKNHDLAMESGDIEVNQVVEVIYEATDDTYQLQSHVAVVRVEGADVDIVNATTETSIDASSDTVLVYDDDAAANRQVTIANITGFVRETAQATTGAVNKDFASLPATIQTFMVSFDAVSISGNNHIEIQLGIAAGFVTSGYTSTSGEAGNGILTINSTSGFIIYVGAGGALMSGLLTITRLTGDVWVASGNIRRGTESISVCAGTSGDIGGELTQVRIAATGGDTLDSGQAGVMHSQ